MRLGETTDVGDRLIEGSPDPDGQAVAGGPQFGRVDQESAIGSPTAELEVCGADRRVPACPHGFERVPGKFADRRVGCGPTADERRVLAPGLWIASRDGGEVEPAKSKP